jgi:hypothetical protein
MTDQERLQQLQKTVELLQDEVRQLKSQLGGIPIRWPTIDTSLQSGIMFGKITSASGGLTRGGFLADGVRRWRWNPMGGLVGATNKVYDIGDAGFIPSLNSPLIENQLIMFGRVDGKIAYLGHDCG